MTEREMEDLIAAYPEDFFPNKGFQLKARQQSFAGVGRFDLLFVDRFGTNVLMELKAVPAKYEVANQLARYRDELLARGEKHVLMWLVAPSISASIREFMDRIGIEYTEIHETEFRLVSGRYGITLLKESSQERGTTRAVLSPSQSPEEPAESRRRRNPAAPVVIHETFKDVMESMILPQQTAHPDHVRLDGSDRGPNGKAGFLFRHHDKVWQINLDTHYKPLKIAYDLFMSGGADPFVEEPTQTGKGTRLRLRQGSTNLFIYLSKRRAGCAIKAPLA